MAPVWRPRHPLRPALGLVGPRDLAPTAGDLGVGPVLVGVDPLVFRATLIESGPPLPSRGYV